MSNFQGSISNILSPQKYGNAVEFINTSRPFPPEYFNESEGFISLYSPVKYNKGTSHIEEIYKLLLNIQPKVLQHFKLAINVTDLVKEYSQDLKYKEIYLYIQKVNYPQ